MPGLTFHSREKRLQYALNVLFFNPSKSPSMQTIIGAIKILQSYDRYYRTHKHPNPHYRPISELVNQAFLTLPEAESFDREAADRLINDLKQQLSKIQLN
jgi:hypothetical protein